MKFRLRLLSCMVCIGLVCLTARAEQKEDSISHILDNSRQCIWGNWTITQQWDSLDGWEECQDTYRGARLEFMPDSFSYEGERAEETSYEAALLTVKEDAAQYPDKIFEELGIEGNYYMTFYPEKMTGPFTQFVLLNKKEMLLISGEGIFKARKEEGRVRTGRDAGINVGKQNNMCYGTWMIDSSWVATWVNKESYKEMYEGKICHIDRALADSMSCKVFGAPESMELLAVGDEYLVCYDFPQDCDWNRMIVASGWGTYLLKGDNIYPVIRISDAGMDGIYDDALLTAVNRTGGMAVKEPAQPESGQGVQKEPVQPESRQRTWADIHNIPEMGYRDLVSGDSDYVVCWDDILVVEKEGNIYRKEDGVYRKTGAGLNELFGITVEELLQGTVRQYEDMIVTTYKNEGFIVYHMDTARKDTYLYGKNNWCNSSCWYLYDEKIYYIRFDYSTMKDSIHTIDLSDGEDLEIYSPGNDKDIVDFMMEEDGSLCVEILTAGMQDTEYFVVRFDDGKSVEAEKLWEGEDEIIFLQGGMEAERAELAYPDRVCIMNDGFFMWDSISSLKDRTAQDDSEKTVNAISKYDFQGKKIATYRLVDDDILQAGYYLQTAVCGEDRITGFFVNDETEDLYISQILLENGETHIFSVKDLKEVRLDGQEAEDFYLTNTGNGTYLLYINEENELYVYSEELNSFTREGQGSSGIFQNKYMGMYRVAENVVHTDCSESFFIFLTRDGKLYGMGGNDYGILPTEEKFVFSPVLLMDNVKYALCGKEDVVVLKNDGSVWTWGGGKVPDKGDGKEYDINGTTPVRILDNISMITGRTDAHAALSEDGEVWTWGNNTYDKCGVEGQGMITEPVCVAKDTAAIWMDRLQYNVDCLHKDKWLQFGYYGYNIGYCENLIIKKTDGSLWTCGKDIKSTKNSNEIDDITFTYEFRPCAIVKEPDIFYDGLRTYQPVLDEYARAWEDETYTVDKWQYVDESLLLYRGREEYELRYSYFDPFGQNCKALVIGIWNEEDEECSARCIYTYDSDGIIPARGVMEQPVRLYDGGIIEERWSKDGKNYYKYIRLEKYFRVFSVLACISEDTAAVYPEERYYDTWNLKVMSEQEFYDTISQYTVSPLELQWRQLE